MIRETEYGFYVINDIFKCISDRCPDLAAAYDPETGRWDVDMRCDDHRHHLSISNTSLIYYMSELRIDRATIVEVLQDARVRKGVSAPRLADRGRYKTHGIEDVEDTGIKYEVPMWHESESGGISYRIFTHEGDHEDED